MIIEPQPGPQTAFLACAADVAFYGGAAGSGKTFAALLAAAQWVDRPGYSAVVFRRTSPELTGGGSVWEASQSVYRALGGAPRQAPTLDWRFPSGALVEFRHLQYEGDVHAHQGKAYACIIFEEATHFEEGQFWYLLSRMRSTCGVRPHFRGTCNPDPRSFVRRLISWWIDDATGLAIPERSGVLRWLVRDGNALRWYDSRASAEEAHPGDMPLSLTFIGAKLEDNRRGDPSYEARLRALPLVQRRRLLGGDWNAIEEAGSVFRREWFRVVQHRPQAPRRSVRAWDLGATEPSPANSDPDWSRGIAIDELVDGGFHISDMQSCRLGPGPTERFLVDTARLDGPERTQVLWQDPGAAGKADADAKVRAVQVAGRRALSIVAGSSKLAFANVWAPIAEANRITIQDSLWARDLVAELDAFPAGKHDDAADAVSLAFQAWSLVPATDEAGAQVVQVNAAPMLGMPRTHGRRGPW